VSERVAYGTLEHPIDGARADHRMVVFHNEIKFRRARSDSPSGHRRRIIDEQFDPDRRGSHQVWTPSPMRRRLISQKKPAPFTESPATIEPPASIRQSSSAPKASL
jgi:hypothetical protein